MEKLAEEKIFPLDFSERFRKNRMSSSELSPSAQGPQAETIILVFLVLST